MRRVTSYLIALAASALFSSGYSQTIWTGPKMIFEKEDYADWSLAKNQDRITYSVWITRQDNQGIFNIQLESSYDRQNRTSPQGTEWANGQILDGIENLVFTTWQDSKSNSSTDEVGINKVVHLLAEDIYIDIKFLSWSQGGGGSGTGSGGGFSYERSTPTTNSLNHLNFNELRILKQHDQLIVESPVKIKKVTVFTSTGSILFHDNLPTGNGHYNLFTSHFPSGMYVLVVNELYRIKFVR